MQIDVLSSAAGDALSCICFAYIDVVTVGQIATVFLFDREETLETDATPAHSQERDSGEYWRFATVSTGHATCPLLHPGATCRSPIRVLFLRRMQDRCD